MLLPAGRSAAVIKEITTILLIDECEDSIVIVKKYIRLNYLIDLVESMSHSPANCG